MSGKLWDLLIRQDHVRFVTLRCVIRCNIAEEKPEQGKHQHNHCERENCAKKTSHLPFLTDRIGLILAAVRSKLSRRASKKAMPALPAPVWLLSQEARQNVFPTRIAGPSNVGAGALWTSHDEDPDWILTDVTTAVPETLIVPRLRL
jgi:hypothetical protein